MAEEERFTGIVKWFNNSKGFGFIKPDDKGEEDLFVHQSSIKLDGYRCLTEGDLIEFSIVTGDNGKSKAIDVTGPNRSPLHSKKDNHGGRRRRGGDRRNGGAAVAGCYNCGDLGHLARDCDRSNGVAVAGGGGGRGCFRCGELGHLARNCSKESGSNNGGESNVIVGRSTCFNCGKPGHFARECLEDSGSSLT